MVRSVPRVKPTEEEEAAAPPSSSWQGWRQRTVPVRPSNHFGLCWGPIMQPSRRLSFFAWHRSGSKPWPGPCEVPPRGRQPGKCEGALVSSHFTFAAVDNCSPEKLSPAERSEKYHLSFSTMTEASVGAVSKTSPLMWPPSSFPPGGLGAVCTTTFVDGDCKPSDAPGTAPRDRR